MRLAHLVRAIACRHQTNWKQWNFPFRSKCSATETSGYSFGQIKPDVCVRVAQMCNDDRRNDPVSLAKTTNWNSFRCPFRLYLHFHDRDRCRGAVWHEQKNLTCNAILIDFTAMINDRVITANEESDNRIQRHPNHVMRDGRERNEYRWCATRRGNINFNSRHSPIVIKSIESPIAIISMVPCRVPCVYYVSTHSVRSHCHMLAIRPYISCLLLLRLVSVIQTSTGTKTTPLKRIRMNSLFCALLLLF